MATIDFTPINQIIDRSLSLSDDKAWLFSLNNVDVQEEIIRLNTEDQLYDQGIDSEGITLGEYSQFTVAAKRRKGQRVDHVTLRDTGEFYSTWRVIVYHDAFEIDANDVKFDKALFEVYGEDVLGLTQANKERIRDVILNFYMEYAKRWVLYGN